MAIALDTGNFLREIATGRRRAVNYIYQRDRFSCLLLWLGENRSMVIGSGFYRRIEAGE